MHGILKVHFTCSRENLTLVAICNLHGIVGTNLTTEFDNWYLILTVSMYCILSQTKLMIHQFVNAIEVKYWKWGLWSKKSFHVDHHCHNMLYKVINLWSSARGWCLIYWKYKKILTMRWFLVKSINDKLHEIGKKLPGNKK